jgi:pimeloyl-ACP methyl ester carboxylesterase
VTVDARLQAGTDRQDIQADLFYDYRTNVASYPTWQGWLREHQPPLQLVWGRYDPSFQVEEAEAYRREVPAAEVHVLDAGHFALDEHPDAIADLTRGFLGRPTRNDVRVCGSATGTSSPVPETGTWGPGRQWH